MSDDCHMHSFRWSTRRCVCGEELGAYIYETRDRDVTLCFFRDDSPREVELIEYIRAAEEDPSWAWAVN